jgi:hypothetical protein
MEVGNPVCDFGEIWQGEEAHCLFTVKNTGGADLRILEVRPDCGCTVAEVSRDTIPPGQGAEIKATFRSVGYRSQVSKGITLNSDDPHRSQARLTITGLVKVPVDLQPSYVIIADGRPDTVETKQVTIIPYDPKGFRVLAVEGAPSWVHFTEPEPSGGPAGTWKMTVTVGPDLPVGHPNAVLKIKTTDKRQPIALLRVNATVTKDGQGAGGG